VRCFILAGGYATRLWPLTEKRAKPLLPLAWVPLLTHLVRRLPHDLPVTVSTNAVFREAFEEWARTLHQSALSIRIEETKSDDDKLGALGALSQWITREGIQDDILLLAGDNYCGFDFETFLAAFRPRTPLLAAVDLGDRAKASAFGTVVLDEDGRRVIGFEEKPSEPRSSIVSTGCSVIPARVLPLLIVYAQRKPDNIGGLFEECLRRNIDVDCRTFRAPWFDIGSFASYVQATQALVGPHALYGEHAHSQDTRMEGSVVLGRNSRVIGGTLRNTVVFQDCVIEDCVIEDCVIDDGCVLKGIDLTGKMLRAGTRLLYTRHLP